MLYSSESRIYFALLQNPAAAQQKHQLLSTAYAMIFYAAYCSQKEIRISLRFSSRIFAPRFEPGWSLKSPRHQKTTASKKTQYPH